MLIIITGNYNFFNMLAIILGFSLLDDEHINNWFGGSKTQNPESEYRAKMEDFDTGRWLIVSSDVTTGSHQ